MPPISHTDRRDPPLTWAPAARMLGAPTPAEPRGVCTHLSRPFSALRQHLQRRRDDAVSVAAGAAAISVLLGEPAARARALAIESLATNRAFQRTFDRLAALPAAAIDREVAAVACPQQAALQRWFAAPPAPLLLVTLHSGDYLPALLHIADLLPRGQPVLLVRRARPDPREQPLHARFAGRARPFTIVRPGPMAAVAVDRALRARHAAVLMLDVPPSFGPGSRAPATLFGRAASLAAGPATLATRHGARVLPVHLQRGAIVAGSPLLATGGAAAALHGRLAVWMDRAIRASPGEWMLWTHALSFLQPAGHGMSK